MPEPKTSRVRSAAFAPVVLLAVALAGCRSAPLEYARPMPAGLEPADVMGIQVYRNVTTLELTNTTARDFPQATLWLNERYSMPIGDLAIGESLDLPLDRFVNQYGDTFRAGGFFATREPDAVVLAQLESEGSLYGLIVGGNMIK